MDREGVVQRLSKEPAPKRVFNDKGECYICLIELKLEEWLPLKCGHAFHKSCLEDWFSPWQRAQDRLKCPFCRDDVVTQPQRTMCSGVVSSLLTCFWRKFRW